MMDNKNIKIFAAGQDNFRHSITYRDKVFEIRHDIEEKYKNLLNAETNFLNRLILKIKMRSEIRKEISKIDSLDNLHLKPKHG